MNTEIIKAVESDRAQKTFYPTPEPLAEKLLGGIKWNMVDCVLEPSAGKGDLALFAAKKMFYARHSYPPHDDRSIREAAEEADIDCIEIDPLLRNTLEGRGFRVIHDDFLSFETQKRYSLIVMNPPFDQGAEHFLKAFELMEHGGEIRCILNAQTIRNPWHRGAKAPCGSPSNGVRRFPSFRRVPRRRTPNGCRRMLLSKRSFLNENGIVR